MALGLGVGYLTLSVVTAVLCVRDMDRRGHAGELYGVVTLFVLPLGLGLWALDRRRSAPPRAMDGHRSQRIGAGDSHPARPSRVGDPRRSPP